MYKGKIKKDKIPVIIKTALEMIEGNAHLIPDNRLLDMLNTDIQNFIAISDAKVYSLNDGKLLSEANFLAVNKEQIVLILEKK